MNDYRIVGRWSAPLRYPLALLPCLVAVLLLVFSTAGEASPPRNGGEPSPPLPDVPDGTAPGTVSVDLSRAIDPNPFRRGLTPGQRIHTHLDLGRVFEAHGNYEAALMEYQQGLAACERRGIGRSHSSEESLAHRRIGNALDRLGRFAQAEMHYKKAIKCNPRDPKIWNDAGYSYYLQGRWADAERTFKTAGKLAPDDPRIQTNLGLTLAAAGRTSEALPFLSRFSGDAIGHANLGYMLAATGQVELARQQYLQALALRPNLPLAERALAQLDRVEKTESVAAVAPPIPPPIQPATAAPAQTQTGDHAVMKAAASRTSLPQNRRPAAQPSYTRSTLP
jgi:Flp pilus assembly protein TadD